MMFQHRASEFDPRVSAIAGHLRAIEKELGGIGRSASRNASANASTAGKQIAEAIWPILNDIVDRFGRGQRAAVDEAASWGNEAVKIGAKASNDAFGRIAIGQNAPSCRIRGRYWRGNFDWCCCSQELAGATAGAERLSFTALTNYLPVGGATACPTQADSRCRSIAAWSRRGISG